MDELPPQKNKAKKTGPPRPRPRPRPNFRQPNAQPQDPKKAAVECITQHLNGYIYELKRNGASADFINRVQSEATWAINELATSADGEKG